MEQQLPQEQLCCCKADDTFDIHDIIEQALNQGYQKGYTAGRCEADERIQRIAEHYGYESQREQFVEECAEAILAVQKCKRYGNKDNFDDLCGEVADVLIMGLQMRLLMSPKKIDNIMESKLNRQIQRIQMEKNAI